MNESFEKLKNEIKSESELSESLTDINLMITALEQNFDDADKKIKLSYENLSNLLVNLKKIADNNSLSKEELMISLRNINLNLVDVLSVNNRKIFKLLNSFRAITQTKIGKYHQ